MIDQRRLLPLEESENEEGVSFDADGDCMLAGTGDDLDGVSAGDNCPSVSNPTQVDGDGDGIGDACELSPRGLKLAALAQVGQLEAALSGQGASVAHHLDKAAERIEQSLEARRWRDDFNLNRRLGKRVFDREIQAVGQLEWVKRHASLSTAQADLLADTMGKLATADQILARVARDEAAATGATGQAMNKANAEYASGTALLAKADGNGKKKSLYQHGMRDFRAAWKHAMRAFHSMRVPYEAQGFRDDEDYDGIHDPTDNCQLNQNSGQTDKDKDRVGNTCDGHADADADGDGFRDANDKCIWIYNRDQLDRDGDGIGDACDNSVRELTAGDYCTYVPSSWDASCSSGSSSSIGCVRDNNFAARYPSGVTVGGVRTARFTTASKVTTYLPASGPAAALLLNVTDPTKKTAAGVFLDNVLALKMNVDYATAGHFTAARRSSPAFTALKVKSGTLAGRTVADVLDTANAVLGADLTRLPLGMTIGGLSDAVAAMNGEFENCQVARGMLTMGVADFDGDGVSDAQDNCPFVRNPIPAGALTQSDADRDTWGDECDDDTYAMYRRSTDQDRDGVLDESDNCPFMANVQQVDVDNDGIGDACEVADDCFDLRAAYRDNDTVVMRAATTELASVAAFWSRQALMLKAGAPCEPRAPVAGQCPTLPADCGCAVADFLSNDSMVTLTGLQPGMTYAVRAVAVTPSGNVGISSVKYFTSRQDRFPDADGGLIATIDFGTGSARRRDATVDFASQAGTRAFGAGTAADGRFHASWLGLVRADRAGAHRFSTSTDDGVTLSIDDRPIESDWTGDAGVDRPRNNDGSILLAAGYHKVRMTFFNPPSATASAILRWSPPGGSGQADGDVVVPQTHLRPLDDAPFDFNAPAIVAGPTLDCGTTYGDPVLITFATDELATYSLRYGPAECVGGDADDMCAGGRYEGIFGNVFDGPAAESTSHTITLSDVEAGILNHFVIDVTDRGGNTTTVDLNAMTCTPPGAPPPNRAPEIPCAYSSDLIVDEQETRDGTSVDFGCIATDDRDPAPNLAYFVGGDAVDNPHVYPLGDTIVTVVAWDGEGASASRDFTVRIVDTRSPLVDAGPDLVVECTNLYETPVAGSGWRAADVCDADPVMQSDAPAGFVLGTTTVTVTAVDDSGNSGVDDHLVTVVDTTPPTVRVGADARIIEAPQSGVCGSYPGRTPVTIARPIADDACWYDQRWIWLSASVEDNPPCQYVNGNMICCVPTGTTTVTWRAQDPSGNASFATWNVTVIPQTLLDMSLSGPSGWRREASVTASVTGLCEAVEPAAWSFAGASFSCGKSVVSTATSSTATSDMCEEGVYCPLTVSVADSCGGVALKQAPCFGIDKTMPYGYAYGVPSWWVSSADPLVYVTIDERNSSTFPHLFSGEDPVITAAAYDAWINGAYSGLKTFVATIDPGTDDERTLIDETFTTTSTPIAGTGPYYTSSLTCDLELAGDACVAGPSPTQNRLNLDALRAGVPHRLGVMVTDQAGNYRVAYYPFTIVTYREALLNAIIWVSSLIDNPETPLQSVGELTAARTRLEAAHRVFIASRSLHGQSYLMVRETLRTLGVAAGKGANTWFVEQYLARALVSRIRTEIRETSARAARTWNGGDATVVATDSPGDDRTIEGMGSIIGAPVSFDPEARIAAATTALAAGDADLMYGRYLNAVLGALSAYEKLSLLYSPFYVANSGAMVHAIPMSRSNQDEAAVLAADSGVPLTARAAALSLSNHMRTVAGGIEILTQLNDTPRARATGTDHVYMTEIYLPASQAAAITSDLHQTAVFTSEWRSGMALLLMRFLNFSLNWAVRPDGRQAPREAPLVAAAIAQYDGAAAAIARGDVDSVLRTYRNCECLSLRIYNRYFTGTDPVTGLVRNGSNGHPNPAIDEAASGCPTGDDERVVDERIIAMCHP